MKFINSFERNRVQLDLEGQQKRVDDSHGNDTDVNKIVARFQRTGIMPPPSIQPIYDDVTALQGDLTEIIQKGREAAEELQTLQKAARDAQDQVNKSNAEKVASMGTPNAATATSPAEGGELVTPPPSP